MAQVKPQPYLVYLNSRSRKHSEILARNVVVLTSQFVAKMDFTKESVSASSKGIIGVTWRKMGKIAGTGLLKMDGTGHLVLVIWSEIVKEANMKEEKETKRN